MWDERRIFSKHFLERLSSTWSTHSKIGSTPTKSSTSRAITGLLVGDPNAVGFSNVSDRVKRQTKCSAENTQLLLDVIPKTVNGLLPYDANLPRVPSGDLIRALAVSLSAELNV